MKLPKLRRRAGGTIDRRGAGAPPMSGGLGRVPMGGGRLPIPGGAGGGIGAIVVVVLLVVLLPRLLGGGDGVLGNALDPFGQAGLSPPANEAEVDPSDPTGRFVDAVGDDVQTVWADIFDRSGKRYEDTAIVLFSGGTSTGCGQASSATGPFYCPADRRVYIDTSFFKELERRFGASGDFAEAYVIAHEIGHHVQTLLGIEGEVRRLSREDPSRANDLSIRLELQADCFAGVWGRSANGAGILEAGDLEEGLGAAAAVGDDRIQEAATGRVDPESWTHGSAEQRTQWFRTGFQVGNPDACDTFTNDI